MLHIQHWHFSYTLFFTSEFWPSVYELEKVSTLISVWYSGRLSVCLVLLTTIVWLSELRVENSCKHHKHACGTIDTKSPLRMSQNTGLVLKPFRFAWIKSRVNSPDRTGGHLSYICRAFSQKTTTFYLSIIKNSSKTH